ncbi:hypothetical protein HDU97_004784, partial [Phlyctochytrium planicorne]
MVGLEDASVERGRSLNTGVGGAGRSLSVKKIQTPAPIDALLADLDNMIRKQSVSGPSSSPSSSAAPASPTTPAKPRDSKFSDADGKESTTQRQSTDASAESSATSEEEGMTIRQLMEIKEGGKPAMIMCGFLQKLSLS